MGQVFSQLKCFFEGYRSALSSSKVLTFGLSKKDDVDMIFGVVTDIIF